MAATPEATRKLGNEAFQAGQFAKAVMLYTQAGDSTSIANRAAAYNKLNRYALAAKDCGTVLAAADVSASTMNKVYQRLGFALYMIGTAGELENPYVSTPSTPEALDCFRTAAHYLAKFTPEDEVSQTTRLTCYRRLLAANAFNAPEREGVPSSVEGVEMVTSLSVCMLCFGANGNARMVRSNLVPDALLDLPDPARPTGAEELSPFIPRSELEDGLCQALLPGAAHGPVLRQSMFCAICEEFVLDTGERQLAKHLVHVHDPLSTRRFAWLDESYTAAQNSMLYRGFLLARSYKYTTSRFPESLLLEKLMKIRTALLAHRTRWVASPEGRRDRHPEETPILNVGCILDVDNFPNTAWPLNRRHYRAEMLAGWVVVQLGLFYYTVILSGTKRSAEAVHYGNWAERVAENRAALTTDAHKLHMLMLIEASHPLQHDPVRLAELLVADSNGHYLVTYMNNNTTDAGQGNVMIQARVPFNPDPNVRILAQDFPVNRMIFTTGLLIIMFPLGYEGTFPYPRGTPPMAMVEIADMTYSKCFGEHTSTRFVLDFSSPESMRMPVPGNTRMDYIIATLYLNQEIVIETLSNMWRQACGKAPGGGGAIVKGKKSAK